MGRPLGDRRKHRRTKAVRDDLDTCGPEIRDLVVLQAVAECRDGVGVRPPAQVFDQALECHAPRGHAVQVHDQRPAVVVW